MKESSTLFGKKSFQRFDQYNAQKFTINTKYNYSIYKKKLKHLFPGKY